MTSPSPSPASDPPASSPTTGARGPDLIGRLAAVAVFLIAGWASLAPLHPPSPAPADAPPETFSAARAMTHLTAIAATPHPVGTAVHDRVRDYLVEQLEQLGLEPRVEPKLALRDRGSGIVTAAVAENVVARLPGRVGGPGLSSSSPTTTPSPPPRRGR